MIQPVRDGIEGCSGDAPGLRLRLSKHMYVIQGHGLFIGVTW